MSRVLSVSALALLACNAVNGAGDLEIEGSDEINAPDRTTRDGSTTTTNGDAGPASGEVGGAFDASVLPPGLYVARLTTAEGDATRRIVVTR